MCSQLKTINIRYGFLILVMLTFGNESLAAADNTISSEQILRLIAKGKPVSITGKTIEGDLDFTRLPSYKTGPENAEVSVNVPVYFEKCRFKGRIIGFKERGGVLISTFFRFNFSLADCVLYQDLNIRSSRIDGIFSLAGSEINGNVYAENLDVRSDAFFNETLFAREVYFQNSHFWGRAGFSKATFNEVSYFQACRFSDEAIFRECVFAKSADFSLGRFVQLCSFSYSVISGKILLSNSRFEKQLEFVNVTFGELYINHSLFFSDRNKSIATLPGVVSESAIFAGLQPD